MSEKNTHCTLFASQFLRPVIVVSVTTSIKFDWLASICSMCIGSSCSTFSSGIPAANTGIASCVLFLWHFVSSALQLVMNGTESRNFIGIFFDILCIFFRFFCSVWWLLTLFTWCWYWIYVVWSQHAWSSIFNPATESSVSEFTKHALSI